MRALTKLAGATAARLPARLAPALAAGALLLAACGGGALDNPDSVQNGPSTGARKLSFIYYQLCVNPIFLAPLQINQNGVLSINTCAAAGCHDNSTGTGGAFRLIGSAPAVDPSGAPDAIRLTDMYKNFFSSQGEVVMNDPLASRLLTKPLLLNVLHGGGLIFEDQQDPNVRLIQYWITHPMPEGQDEFSTAASGMFAGGVAASGNCLTQ